MLALAVAIAHGFEALQVGAKAVECRFDFCRVHGLVLFAEENQDRCFELTQVTFTHLLDQGHHGEQGFGRVALRPGLALTWVFALVVDGVTRHGIGNALTPMTVDQLGAFVFQTKVGR